MEEKTIYKCECGRVFESKTSRNSHYRFCKVHKPIKRYDENGKYISPSKYKVGDIYICECGKEFNNHQSLNGHFSHCECHNKHLSKKTIKRTNNIKNNKGSFKYISEEKREAMRIKAHKTLRERLDSGQITPTWKGKHLPEEMNEKIRKGRVEYLKTHNCQHGAWDKSKMTYLENWFNDILLENNLYEKYSIKVNYSVYPYFLDFAFLDLKLDVEVDGKFHYTYKTNIEHDIKRNNYLENLGWKLFRISFDEVKNNELKIKNEFLKYLYTFNEKSESRFYIINI